MKKFLYLFLLVSSVATVFLYFIPHLVDRKSIVASIKQQISTKLDAKIEFSDDLKISFIPSPQISVKKIKISSKLNKNAISMTSNKIIMSTSWGLLLSSEPKIKKIFIESPKFLINYSHFHAEAHEFEKSLLTFVKIDEPNKKIENFLDFFKTIKVKSGQLLIKSNQNFFLFQKINLKISNSETKKISGDFLFKNINSTFNLDVTTKDLKKYDFKVNQKISENVINWNLKLLFDNTIEINGKVYSDAINLNTIELPIKMNKFNTYSSFHKININFFKYPRINIHFEIKEIFVNEFSFSNNRFNLVLMDDFVRIKNFNSNISDSVILLDSKTNLKNKKTTGIVTLSNYQFPENLFEKTRFDIRGGKMSLDINFKNDNFVSDYNNFISNTDFNGSFKIISPVLVGIDIKKVVDQFNNISGIADVMPILNGNFLQGFSQLEEINGFFSSRNKNIKLKDIFVIHSNLINKIAGDINLRSQEIKLENKVKLKISEKKTFPDFRVFLTGKIDDPKISFDLENLKKALITDSLNKILKQNKKIIIDPSNMLDLFLNNSEKKNLDLLNDLIN